MIALLTFLAIIVAALVVFVRMVPDFAVVTTAMGFAALFLMAVGARVLGDTIGFEWDNASRLISALALLTLWCAAMTAATVKLLTVMRRYVDSGGADD